MIEGSGSGSVPTSESGLMDPDPDPGGTKTYESDVSGSATLPRMVPVAVQFN